MAAAIQMEPLLCESSGAPENPWQRQPRLDAFFRLSYRYFQSKGLACMVAERVLDLVITLFIALLTLFLLGGAVDYAALEQRIHSPECPNSTENRATLFEADCHGTRPVDVGRLWHMSVFWILMTALFSAGWGVALVQFMRAVPDWLYMRRFYRDAMNIRDRDMATVSWTDVMQRLIAAQEAYRMCTTVARVDQLHITNLITRRTNYYVALYTEGILDPSVHIPCWGKREFLPLSLHWNIDRIISGCVFDSNNNLSQEFHRATEDAMVATINRTYRVMALLNLLLAPLILLYRIAYFFFHFSGEWRKSASALSTRQWSPLALWRLREYCEVDHHFRERLSRSYRPACEYIGMFGQPLTSVFARMLGLLVGGFLVILILGGIVYDEDFFLVNLTEHRSVTWWVGVLGVVLAWSTVFVSNEHAVFEPERKLREVAVHTHYYPDGWEAASIDTKGQFSQLFQYKLAVFAEEVLSVVITPWLMAFRLPKSTRAMVRFFRQQTTSRDGIGDVCTYSLFDNDLYDQESVMVRSSYAGDDTPHNKMDVSYINFQRTFPTWQHH